MANEPILSGEHAERERAKVIEALTEHFAVELLYLAENAKTVGEFEEQARTTWLLVAG